MGQSKLILQHKDGKGTVFFSLGLRGDVVRTVKVSWKDHSSLERRNGGKGYIQELKESGKDDIGQNCKQGIRQ